VTPEPATPEPDLRARREQARQALARLAVVARGQHGTFSPAQALHAGVTERTIERKLASGEWVMLHPGVLAAATTERTFELRASAAVLAIADPVALCGRSGAYALEMSGFRAPLEDEDLELVMAAGRHRPDLDGVVVRQRRGLCDADVRKTPSGLYVLERHLLLGDLGRLESTGALLRVVQEEAFHSRVDLHRLAGTRRRGRPGSATLGRVLSTLAEHHDTLTEVEGCRLLRWVGIEDVQPNVAPYAGMRPPDALIAAARLAIDYQGPVHRRSRAKQNTDSDKVTEYALCDYLLLTPTNDTIWQRGERWAREVKEIADERRARYAG
jgi:hypothetical protein